MSYNAQDIETLSFAQAVKQRIAMYMGSADNQGVLQCIREIITNSIDEATMGFGKKIIVEIDSNKNLVRVKDNGRGVPFGIRDDGTEAMEAIYTMPHTGGKFNEKTYQNVAGMNGIGSKGVALSSSYFKAVSFRDHKKATLELKDGVKVGFTIKDLAANDTSRGTGVEFIPSQEVYNLEPIQINFEEVIKMCRDWSYLMKGIEFDVIDLVDGSEHRFLAKNGLLDMMHDNQKKPLNKTPLHIELEEDKISAEIVMEWTDSRNEECHVFTNGLENSEGGTSLTGIKTALTNFFKKKLKGEASADILRKGLYYAVSCKVPNPSFANQTKTKVNNPELRGLCQRATTQMLEEFELKHKDEFDKIIDLLTRELHAEAAAEKARQQVLNTVKEINNESKKRAILADKLKDCQVHGPNSGAVLAICEGETK